MPRTNPDELKRIVLQRQTIRPSAIQYQTQKNADGKLPAEFSPAVWDTREEGTAAKSRFGTKLQTDLDLYRKEKDMFFKNDPTEIRRIKAEQSLLDKLVERRRNSMILEEELQRRLENAPPPKDPEREAILREARALQLSKDRRRFTAFMAYRP